MFIVANGSNSDTANSYVSVAYADEYNAVRNNTAWSGKSTQIKQAALVKATDFIEQMFSGAWPGYTESTGLAWPRIDAGVDSIPERVKKAVCELALQSLTIPLFAPVNREPQLKRKKIDVIEKEYFEQAANAGSQINKAALAYLRPLFGGMSSGINRKVIRA